MKTLVTPQEKYPQLAKTLGIDALYFKREDLHPYQSHKGRSIPVIIDEYVAQGDRRFAISSSGNAALAATLHIQKLNSTRIEGESINLEVYVGIHIDKDKLDLLKSYADSNIRVLSKERPLQAVTLASGEGVRSLRQSTDDLALKGYEVLAEEIASTKDVGAVFVASSSGTTAQALAEYFLAHSLPIQVHLVQTTSCHPFADDFELFEGTAEPSIADAIIGQSSPRRPHVVSATRKSGGFGWIATNNEIQTAQELTEKHASISLSTNSALAVAGVMQAVYRSWDFGGAVVCIIGGR